GDADGGGVAREAVVLVDDPRPDGEGAVIGERAGRARAGGGRRIVDRAEGGAVAVVLVVEAGGRVGRRRIELVLEADRRGAALVDRAVVGQDGRRGHVGDRDDD